MGVGGGGSRGGRGVGLVRGGAAPPGPPRGGRQPPDGPQVRRSGLADPDRSLRRAAGTRARARDDGRPARRGARRGLHVPPRASETPVARGGPETPGVRAVRPGRDVARPDDVARARPRQRRTRRPPAREPADAVPELQRDARHALRQAQDPQAPRPRVSGVRRGVPAHHRRAALLLAVVRRPRRGQPAPSSGHGAASYARPTSSSCARSTPSATPASGAATA